SHSAPAEDVASAPAITSEWPFRYLVAACMTMSAPCSRGRVSIGLAHVESTASTAPAPCAIFATAAKSVIDHSGLAGVSSQMSLAEPGRTEAFTASTSLISTRSTFKPQRTASLVSQLRSDQYMTLGAMTWSRGESARNTD